MSPAVPAAIVNTLTLIPSHRRTPAIGVGASTSPTEHTPQIPAPADFILVELDAGAPNWRGALTRAASSGLALDVRIVTDRPDDVPAVIDALHDEQVIRVGVFSASTHVTERALWNALQDAVAATRLDVELVGGARSHFTELNRTKNRLPLLDSYTFSLTPQMHAHETAQLIESIPMQRLVARDAGWIAAGAALHVGPVTLRPRFNAVATTAAVREPDTVDGGYGPQFVPGTDDGRQASAPAAAWTIATAAALARAGATSITFFEEWGPRGLKDSAGVYPVHETIEALREVSGHAMLVPQELDDADQLHAVAASVPDGVVLLIANLSSRDRALSLSSGALRAEAVVKATSWLRLHLNS